LVKKQSQLYVPSQFIRKALKLKNNQPKFLAEKEKEERERKHCNGL